MGWNHQPDVCSSSLNMNHFLWKDESCRFFKTSTLNRPSQDHWAEHSQKHQLWLVWLVFCWLCKVWRFFCWSWESWPPTVQIVQYKFKHLKRSNLETNHSPPTKTFSICYFRRKKVKIGNNHPQKHSHVRLVGRGCRFPISPRDSWYFFFKKNRLRSI